MTWRPAPDVTAQGSGPRLLATLAAISALYTVPILRALNPITDLDVWWHLRTGRWIVEHGTIPWTDHFSTQAGKPWIAYSWLFEVALHALYALFGLAGVLVLDGLLVLCITGALHALVHRYRPGVGVELALTGVAVGVMLPLLVQPRSWLLTILFFVLALHVVLAFWESRDRRLLWLLPPVFALWANVHIQFVYGLGLLGLSTGVALIEDLQRPDGWRQGRTLWLALATLGSSLATLVNPYHVHLYKPVIDAVRLTDPFVYITELHALPFRTVRDWLVLMLALGASFLLGRRRASLLLPATLLAGACALSFRAQRDTWVVTIVAVTTIAQHLQRPGSVARWRTPGRLALVAGAVLTILTLTAPPRMAGRRLEAALAETFPVGAAAFVRAHGYEGPIFTDYDWGGFLMWRLPQLSVGLDGRNTFHGDAGVWRVMRTWNGHDGWSADRDLAAARVVIGRPTYPLNALLREDERFERVYEDAVAVVFVARAARTERATTIATSSWAPGRPLRE